jgi:HD-like signal output (HDOD) protein
MAIFWDVAQCSLVDTNVSKEPTASIISVTFRQSMSIRPHDATSQKTALFEYPDHHENLKSHLENTNLYIKSLSYL